MPKNCVVSISPVSPYQLPIPSPRDVGRTRPAGAVEPDHQSEVGGLRDEHCVCGRQRRGSGRAAVLDVDERHPGQTEPRHARVGVAGGVRAAGREADLAPRHAGVGERRPGCVDGHVEAGDAFVSAERVDPRPDDRDVLGRHACSSTAAKAKVTRCSPAGLSAAVVARRIGMPIRRRAGSGSDRSPSTRISPPSST